MNGQVYNERIIFLQSYFGKILEKQIKEMYWQMLKHLTDEQFYHACTTLIRTFEPTSTKPFPLVKDFLGAIGHEGANKFRTALMMVKAAIQRVGRYDSVCFNDRALHHVIDSFGGWVEICNWSNEDWQLQERRFQEYYESASNLKQQGPAYLCGLSEIQNRHSGNEKFIDAPVSIMNIDGKLTYKKMNIVEIANNRNDKKQISANDPSQIGQLIKAIV